MASKMSSKQIGVLAGGAAAALAVTIIAWAALLGPQVSRINEANKAASQQALTNMNLQGEVASLVKKKSNLPQLQAQVDAFSKSFPSGSSQQEWIDQLNTAANDSQVVITSIAPTIPTAPGVTTKATGTQTAAPSAPSAQGKSTGAVSGPVAQIAVSIAVTGTEDGIRAFLDKAEALVRPLLVTSFSISGTGSDRTAVITGNSFLARALVAPSGSKTKTSGGSSSSGATPGN